MTPRGVSSRIVFWMVFVVSLLPTAFFVFLSYVELNETIEHLHQSESTSTLEFAQQRLSSIDDPGTIAIALRAYLEFDTIQNRQARAQSSLAARTWIRYMTCAFGGILIFVGAIFVLAKIETPSMSEIAGAHGDASLSLKSASPGVVMLVVGATLMITPNFAKQTIQVWDRPTFFESLTSFGNDPSPPPSSSEVAQKFLDELENKP